MKDPAVLEDDSGQCAGSALPMDPTSLLDP